MANGVERPLTPAPAGQWPRPTLRCTPMPSLGGTVSAPVWLLHRPAGHGRQSPTQPLLAPCCGPGPRTLNEADTTPPPSGERGAPHARLRPSAALRIRKGRDPPGRPGDGSVTLAPGAETYTSCSGAGWGWRADGCGAPCHGSWDSWGPWKCPGWGAWGPRRGRSRGPRSPHGQWHVQAWGGLGAPGSFPPSADPRRHLRAHRPHQGVPTWRRERWAPSEHTGPVSCTPAPSVHPGQPAGADTTPRARPSPPTTPVLPRILRFPWQLLREQVRQTVAEALQVWSDVTPLTFTEVHEGHADIVIDFTR